MNKEDLIRMAREAAEDSKYVWSKPEHPVSLATFCESFANLVAAAEREACAKVVEQAGIDGYGTLAAALLVRERGNK